MFFAGLEIEDCFAGFHGDESEADELGDRRSRDLAANHTFEIFQSFVTGIDSSGEK